jgi:hypothetical protein
MMPICGPSRSLCLTFTYTSATGALTAQMSSTSNGGSTYSPPPIGYNDLPVEYIDCTTTLALKHMLCCGTPSSNPRALSFMPHLTSIWEVSLGPLSPLVIRRKVSGDFQTHFSSNFASALESARKQCRFHWQKSSTMCLLGICNVHLSYGCRGRCSFGQYARMVLSGVAYV